MDFESRLERAIQRGQLHRDAQGRLQAEKAMSEDELKRLHTKCRLDLSEHIEQCLHKLVDHFPGFRYQTIVGEEGWGARVNRDDLDLDRSRSARSLYSRLELVIRPFSQAHIVELAAKGTIRNKEVLHRTHFQFLAEVDVDSFNELIDLWVLEYAEQYSSRT
jgi:hypothetical protein